AHSGPDAKETVQVPHPLPAPRPASALAFGAGRGRLASAGSGAVMPVLAPHAESSKNPGTIRDVIEVDVIITRVHSPWSLQHGLTKRLRKMLVRTRSPLDHR